MSDFLEINNTFSLSEQPEKIKKKLKNHQLALLNQCKTLEDNDYITISNINLDENDLSTIIEMTFFFFRNAT